MATVSTEYLSNLIECSVALGAPSQALYDLVPGGRQALAPVAARFPAELTALVLDTAAALTEMDSLGLRVGLQFRPATFQDVGAALAAASTIREALEINFRFQPLLQEVTRTTLELDRKDASIVLAPAIADPAVMRRVTEVVLAGYASIGRWLLRDQEHPVRAARFRHARPAEATMRVYTAVFGEDVSFGAPRDMLVFDAKLAARPLPNGNPAMVQMLTGGLNARLAAHAASSSLRGLVMAVLHKQIRTGKPSVEDAARLLGMSGRTLRRKLQAEAMSFSDLLAAARKEAAVVYMHEGKLTLTDIAGLLGYSDQTAFMRAFKGWFGTSPGLYRERLRRGG